MIPSLKIQSPELVEKPHEAHLLKLDISKAVTLLNWRPLLNFHQTVEFTVQGYLDELNPGKDLYEARLAQIESYSQNYFIPISNDIPA
jgi:CDP-glucose 4,6-dehydratase